MMDEWGDRVRAGAGHRDRQSAVPDPLAPGSVLARVTTLGLPAATLFWGSLLAFLIVLTVPDRS